MISRLLFGSSFSEAIIGIALSLPAILLCLTIHEFSHGITAYALGDRTAKYAGRLSFDPFAHIDPLGFLCMMIFGFGWAKPVPINVSNFKNRKLGMALTALAGPVSNFVLSYLGFIAYFVLINNFGGSTFISVVAMFFMYTAQISVGLGVFNLIPIHPLDGSRILDAVLPFHIEQKLNAFIRKNQTLIMLAVIAVLWFGGLNNAISWAMNKILNLSIITLNMFF